MDSSSNSTAGKSGPGAKRKFSFLDALSPEERALFEEHARDDDDDVPSCSGTQRSANRRRRRAKAASSEGQSAARPATQEAPSRSEKRKGGQITPQVPPKPKRIREDKPQEASGRRSYPNQQPISTESRKYSEAVSSIRMAVVPRNYPAEALEPEQLTALQNCLVKALSIGNKFTGAFNGIFFKGGMLLVDCQEEKSATWLKEITPRLEGWKGPALCVKRGEEIPRTHSMVAFFPRSAEDSYDFVLSLVRNQNEGLSTSAWKVVASSVVGSGWNLNITMDDESYKFIRLKGFKLNFRFGKIMMRPWRPKAASTSQEAKTGMNVAPAPPVARPAAHEATAAVASGKDSESPSEPISAGQVATAAADADESNGQEGKMSFTQEQEATASVVSGEDSESPSGLISAGQAATTAADADESNGQEEKMPSTQELLEGLEMQVDEGDEDGDLSLLEPIL
ncbi:uncharacterized protein LOC120768697 [Bactrocera tryoni]|uniref:uncharacterized protein LOC120768697 n=2 Tax=Bactrocera tyroni species complex TaxID=98808 RepID=UPI001A9598DF|nr:uncharacterized protein LOC120768697 [Bactrocera tryoni]